MQRAYRASTQALSAVLMLLGLAMVVTTVASGGGPATLGFVLGLMLACLGAARLWMALRADP